MPKTARLMVIVLALCGTLPVSASRVDFIDPSDFANAAGTTVSTNFSPLPDNTDLGNPFSYEGSTFSSDSGDLFSGAPGTLDSYTNFLTGRLAIVIVLPANSSAAAVRAGGNGESGSNILTATTAQGNSLTEQTAFFGFTSSDSNESVSALRIASPSAGSGHPVLGELQTAAVHPTAEPLTFLLFLSGATAVAIGRRRRSPVKLKTEAAC